MENNFRSVISTRDFAFNCGIDEHQLSTLNAYSINTPKKIISYFNWYFSPAGGDRRGAALVFTDNNDTGDVQKALSEISEKICLGRNSNSGNRIYMWVLSRQSIENYERKKNNSKKIIKKTTGKKGGKKIK